MNNAKNRMATAALSGWISLVSPACGPWLPEAYILRNDEVFYAAPALGFEAELRPLLPEKGDHSALPERIDEGGAELLEGLKTEVAAMPLREEERLDLLEAYKGIRSALDKAKSLNACSREEADRKRDALRKLSVPGGLPDEFRLYLEGALAFHLSDLETARNRWRALLALAEDRRRYHSVTAAYMLARTTQQGDTNQGNPDYERVRELARTGFHDPMGLAAASMGWQARYDFQRGAYAEAIEGYLTQWAAGYRSAVQSLRTVAGAAFIDAPDENFASLVAQPRSRAVLTAYVLDQPGGEKADVNRERLLRALRANGNPALKEAGRFALLAYQRNQLGDAREWLASAEPADALALWIRGKLMLRDGRLEEGRVLIENLTRMLDQQPADWRGLDTRRAWGELGLLYLREGEFPGAAGAFRNAGSWRDCAYVLERLMTPEQAMAWARAFEPVEEGSFAWRGGDPQALVARRLMREGRFEEALTFFNERSAARARIYVTARRNAGDLELDDRERARHFWTAARVMRGHGLDLFGSELYPDYAWYGGSFNFGEMAELRKDRQHHRSYFINRATEREIEQSRTTRVKPMKRFHYRYRAAQLAELAAGLLPNDDPDAARIYWIAGGWLKNRDPEAADRFFKYLVVRCPRTALGRAARKINWFPKPDAPVPEPFLLKQTDIIGK